MERVSLKRLQISLLTSLVMLVCSTRLDAQQDIASQVPTAWQLPNLKTRTLGGVQFWSDVKFSGGWKIQRNSTTGHHRLIDIQNYRHAWGTFHQCDRELNSHVNRLAIKSNRGRVMIILHGLGNSRASMRKLSSHLANKGGYTVVDFEYASSRADVATHAADLHDVIRRLGPAVTEINFVAHSMGNIVIRHYLKDRTDPTTGRQGDPRIKRLVMIGPPNHGSKMAVVLKNNLIFKAATGTSGQQLGIGWIELEPRLSVPRFEFGIIAGAHPAESLLDNFVLDGADDSTVSLEEAKLVGARDLFVRPMLHATMSGNDETLKAALNFFRYGYFETAQSRSPIVAPQKVIRR